MEINIYYEIISTAFFRDYDLKHNKTVNSFPCPGKVSEDCFGLIRSYLLPCYAYYYGLYLIENGMDLTFPNALLKLGSIKCRYLVDSFRNIRANITFLYFDGIYTGRYQCIKNGVDISAVGYIGEQLVNNMIISVKENGVLTPVLPGSQTYYQMMTFHSGRGIRLENIMVHGIGSATKEFYYSDPSYKLDRSPGKVLEGLGWIHDGRNVNDRRLYSSAYKLVSGTGQHFSMTTTKSRHNKMKELIEQLKKLRRIDLNKEVKKIPGVRVDIDEYIHSETFQEVVVEEVIETTKKVPVHVVTGYHDCNPILKSSHEKKVAELQAIVDKEKAWFNGLPEQVRKVMKLDPSIAEIELNVWQKGLKKINKEIERGIENLAADEVITTFKDVVTRKVVKKKTIEPIRVYRKREWIVVEDESFYENIITELYDVKEIKGFIKMNYGLRKKPLHSATQVSKKFKKALKTVHARRKKYQSGKLRGLDLEGMQDFERMVKNANEWSNKSTELNNLTKEEVTPLLRRCVDNCINRYNNRKVRGYFYESDKEMYIPGKIYRFIIGHILGNGEKLSEIYEKHFSRNHRKKNIIIEERIEVVDKSGTI